MGPANGATEMLEAGKQFHRAVGLYLEKHLPEGEDQEVRDLKDLLRNVLSRIPEQRGTWVDLKGYAFFKGVNWTEVQQKCSPVKMPVIERMKEVSYRPIARIGAGRYEHYPVNFCETL